MSFHGSDIEKIANTYHISPEHILNFGVNANPLGLSDKVKFDLASHIELITRYPDPSYTSLKNAISQYLDVDTERILPANGTSELIHQIINYFKPQKALLYEPTYSEYANEIKKTGGSIVNLSLISENNFSFPYDFYYESIKKADFVLLCNPNNPTTTLLTTQELLPLIEIADQHQIPFVIDETYIEFTPAQKEFSAISLINQFDNLIILRSFSKFFAAPGLRLGYGLFGDTQLLDKLQTSYPWAIHSLAAYAGEIFLLDKEYISSSNQYILSERMRIKQFLEQIPELTLYPSSINFFLIQLTYHSATDLFEFLIKRKIMIRNFENEIGKGFFRFCMLDQASNDKLLHGIKDFLQLGKLP